MQNVRIQEIKYLENLYSRPGSQMLVLFGENGLGKGSMIKEFIEEKPAVYFRARPVSQREMLIQWGNQLGREFDDVEKEFSYCEALRSMLIETSDKSIIVLQDFQFLFRAGPDFMAALREFREESMEQNDVLMILLTSSVNFVENSLLEHMGEDSDILDGILKIKPVGFKDLCRSFPDYSFNDRLCIYSILGGYAGYWRELDPERSLRDNICRLFLSESGYFRHRTEDILNTELRELSVYNTILLSMAGGPTKLNDIHKRTGFPRAKISVYIRNLSNMNLVEKVESYKAGIDNLQKGLYAITNPLFAFCYNWVFPFLTELSLFEPEEFYDTYVGPELSGYASASLSEISREYMKELSVKGELPFRGSPCEPWYGKTGVIDIVSESEVGECLIGGCRRGEEAFSMEDYEWLLFCCGKAKLEASHKYLFSASGFDMSVEGLLQRDEGIHLIGPDELDALFMPSDDSE